MKIKNNRILGKDDIDITDAVMMYWRLLTQILMSIGKLKRYDNG